MCFVYHSNDMHKTRLSCRSVSLGICIIKHLSIESSVVDESTIRVSIITTCVLIIALICLST